MVTQDYLLMFCEREGQTQPTFLQVSIAQSDREKSHKTDESAANFAAPANIKICQVLFL